MSEASQSILPSSERSVEEDRRDHEFLPLAYSASTTPASIKDREFGFCWTAGRAWDLLANRKSVRLRRGPGRGGAADGERKHGSFGADDAVLVRAGRGRKGPAPRSHPALRDRRWDHHRR